MTPLRQQMIAALQLSGKSERTQQSYVREVRLLAQFYRKSPDRISEQELQHYLLHRKNIDGLAPVPCVSATVASAYSITTSLARLEHPYLLRAETNTDSPPSSAWRKSSVSSIRHPLAQPCLLHHRLQLGPAAARSPFPAGQRYR